MLNQLKTAIVSFIVLSAITGVIYPLVVTGIAQAAFPYEANGSLVLRDGQVAGSALIGQPFDDLAYFWGRPSSTASFPYNAASSAGSNLGPTNEALIRRISERIDTLHSADPGNVAPAPIDLVTASASGLDPNISVASALYQVPRVARVRGTDEAVLRELVRRHTTGRQFGILGEPRVNVLELNLALDMIQ